MKFTLLLILTISSINIFTEEDNQLFDIRTDSLFGPNKFFIFTQEFEDIDWQIMDTVVNNINAKEKKDYYKHYYGNFSFFHIDHANDIEKVGTYNNNNTSSISLYNITEPVIIDSELSLDKPIYTYGVKMHNTTNLRFNVFLLSAYLQEKYPSYKNNDLLFTEFPQKTNSEFLKKTLITPGLGISYLYKNNPVQERGAAAFASFLYYLVDGFFLIPTVGGPFMGDDFNEKLTISSIGLSAMLVGRMFIYFLGRKEVKEYNKLANSPYRVPKYLTK